MIFKRNISTIGLLVGILFFALSLTPSLLPRTNLMQGLISGLALTSGYAVGVLVRRVWSFFELPLPKEGTQRTLTYVSGGLCLLTTVIFLWQATGWQNSLRAMMGLEETAVTRPMVILLASTALFLILLMLARALRWTFRRLSQWLHQRSDARRVG